MTSLLSPFRQTYRYLQRQAHEAPVVFYSCVIGLIGPVMVITVPPIRRSMGWRPAEAIPTTYPLPKRPRRPVEGYDDE
ncbi:NADH-ubiquinone oxidoreductase 9 subunit [Grifola frondosa]|uniref:NADH-ubiquinone oxidoreductase 9 subunit n=1 Tax=Grifola frondosa TaxID=5627 RepID=A0A1C7M9R7_GRIFR|nr:NADH-ubiquinone oxidoreductase 9 subunit [Grifola frondosa]